MLTNSADPDKTVPTMFTKKQFRLNLFGKYGKQFPDS